MTPKRKAALEWVRDDGVPLEIDLPNEPTEQMLMLLERDGLIYYGAQSRDGRGMRYTLTADGREALKGTDE